MGTESGPRPISETLRELFALRGYAREQGQGQLQQIWDQLAGAAIARQTKVSGISRGVLQVQVANSPLLGELTGFHKSTLLAAFKQQHPQLRIRDIKFRLQSGLTRASKPASG